MPPRLPLSLYLLSVAVFAMATSEFMLAGLLPAIAGDLRVSLASAGLLTSAFAAGMAVGAPLMAALARSWPRRSTLVGFLVLFAAAHVVGALTADFAVLVASRIVAALATAGFLAVALRTATDLVAPERKGRAVSILLAGTTVATIAGVPAGAWLGELSGWRATFWTVALLCLPAIAGVGYGVATAAPPTDTTASLRAEIAQLGRYRLALTMFVAAIVNAATFATFTYLAPIVTEVAGLGPAWVGVVLVLFGAGSFVGVTVAGRFSDRRPGTVVAVGGPLLLAGWAALGVFATVPAAVLGLAFVAGALSFAVGSTLIARVLYEAAGAPTMAGSYATAALNVGATAGPLLAGAALGTSLGATAPAWVSAGLVIAGLGGFALLALDAHAAPQRETADAHTRGAR